MDLEFVRKEDGDFVATAMVSSDFNLHIERNFASAIIVKQRTSGEKFAVAKVFPSGTTDVIDADFTGVVYPKEIKIESEYLKHPKETDSISGIITV